MTFDAFWKLPHLARIRDVGINFGGTVYHVPDSEMRNIFWDNGVVNVVYPRHGKFYFHTGLEVPDGRLTRLSCSQVPKLPISNPPISNPQRTIRRAVLRFAADDVCSDC